VLNYGKAGYMKKDCKAPKKMRKREDESNSMNAIIGDDSGDAIVLCADSPIKSWVLDSAIFFSYYLLQIIG
jgi:hypothetical protein